MAAPVYATDLTDITLNEAIGTWVETGTWTTGTAPALEPDFHIQGSNCVAKYWASGGGAGTPGGAIFDAGSVLTIPSPGAFFVWIMHQCPNDIDTEANGGLRVILGDSGSAFHGWKVRGSDSYTFGGWICVPVDPAVTADYTVGAPVADNTRQWFGAASLQLATAKGGLGIDALRYGRGELRCTNGDVTNGYASFGGSSPDAGAAAYDINSTRAWGLCVPRDGSFFQQGLFIMGLAGTAVDFRDSNRVIFIQDTKKVISSFNGFEIRNASSRVDWTNISVTALGTVSRGTFVVTNNADVNLQSCTFTDMDTFTLLSATGALACTFRRCAAVTATGSDMRGSLVAESRVAADASAFVWTDTTETDGLLDDMSFTKGANAHHAISFASTTTGQDYTLRGLDFSGFNATPGSNDSAIYVAATTGTITINLIGCTGTITAKSAGATVVLVVDPVSLSVHVQDIDTGAAIQNARVFVPISESGHGKPYNVTVTITSSGTTATVAHTAHGMASNDKVYISGANEQEYNGVHSITVTGANEYTYTMTGDPASPATGTIKSTFVVIGTDAATGTGGLTDASGNVSASYSWLSDQPVVGRVRKSTAGSQVYKTAPVTGSIDSVTGLSVTVNLIKDT